MTTSSELDTAHFDALPSDPQAAYALGMLHMLQRMLPPSDETLSVACGGLEPEQLAAQVVHFFQDESVSVGEKHALLSEIEHAHSVADVTSAMAVRCLFANHRGEDAAVWEGLSANHSESTDHHLHDAFDDHQHQHANTDAIPEALGCAICCDELMVKPASLLCGHSFCKRCLDIWLKSCPSCPTCRQSVTRATIATSVNVALHEVMASLFPDKLRELEERDHMERLDVLRVLIAKSIETGQPIRELIAQQATQLYDGVHDPHADVSELLEIDTTLQEQLMAAEIRERLRKEKALRESSRRRHVVAYCSTLPASHVRMLSNGYAVRPPAPQRPPPPIPNVQSNRPVKKYVLPPSQKKPFFGSLLRRMHLNEQPRRMPAS